MSIEFNETAVFNNEPVTVVAVEVTHILVTTAQPGMLNAPSVTVEGITPSSALLVAIKTRRCRELQCCHRETDPENKIVECVKLMTQTRVIVTKTSRLMLVASNG